MRYLHIYLTVIIALLYHSLDAQECKVDTFCIDEGNIKGVREIRKDSNDSICALIRVQLPVSNALFRGYTVGEITTNPGEYFVYLTPGAKSLEVYQPGYGWTEVSFKDYGFSCVESKIVYKLVFKPEYSVPQTQIIQIHTSPSNANVILNGEPLTIEDGIAVKTLPFGIYKYHISANGYETQEGQISHYDAENPTVIHISLKKTLVIDNTIQSSPSATGVTGSSPSSPSVELIEKKIESNSFYLEGKFQVGMMMGIGASIGTYINKFNVEGTFLLGLVESEEIAWKSTTQSGSLGYSYTYKPMFYGLKLGYGITTGSSFRITPQVGIGISSISGSQVQGGKGTDPDATNCYAVPASVGVRLEYLFTRNFGISASPEFGFTVMSSDTYTKLSDVSSKVKGFSSGFNARVGIFVSF